MISSAGFSSIACCDEKMDFVHVTVMEISSPLQAA